MAFFGCKWYFSKKHTLNAFQKRYESLWYDFWLMNYKFLKLNLLLTFFAKKCWRHRKFWSQHFLGEIFRKFLWLPSFGTSFTFLTSLLTILRGVGHLDLPPVVPFSKKPSRNRVKTTTRLGLVKCNKKYGSILLNNFYSPHQTYESTE